MHAFRSRALAASIAVTTLAAAAAFATTVPASAATADASQTFSATGGVQTWTVPAGVDHVYVDIAGAQGGAGYGGGGAGAELTGTLSVTPGQQLSVLVGTMGANGRQYSAGGGGGGGSFIYTSPDQAGILAAAGGGGGTGSNRYGFGASTTTTANSGDNGGGAGGTAGNGGGGGTNAGGGGGLLTAGGGSGPGQAVAAGGGGGSGSRPGGFGGGGGSSSVAAGGGGGYSGGGGGGYVNGGAGGGGGGGSYFAGALTGAVADHGGNGFVTIAWPSKLTLVSPNAGLTGDRMSITGSGLAGSMVRVAGVAATVRSSSDTEVVVSVPAQPQPTYGAQRVEVTTASGVTYPVVGAFTYDPAPSVSAVNPTTIVRGSPRVVAITGAGFASATAVRFGTTAATAFTVESDTSITATVPAGVAAGTVDVTVANPNGTSATSEASRLTVTAATIGIAPASIPSATVGSAYSQTLTATGGVAPYAFAVTSGTLPEGLVLSATGVLSGTPTADGTSTFSIGAVDSNDSGDQGTRSYSLEVRPAVPTVSGIDPASGSAYGGTTVTVIGTGFTGATAVAFGDVAAASFRVESDTTITATSPAGTVGTVDLTVTTAGGTTAAGAADDFRFTAPVVTVTTAALPDGKQGTAYSQTLTADGDASDTYAFTVSDGTLPKGLELRDDGTLTGTPTASGTFDVTVTATGVDGYSGSADYSLTIVSSVPTITAVTPPTGVAGDLVTITGTELGGATVTIAGVEASVDPAASNTETTRTVRVPESAPRAADDAVDVVVTNPWGTDTASGAFTYSTTPELGIDPGFGAGDRVAGAEFEVHASGFDAGQDVVGVVHSTPTTVFSGSTGTDGALDATATLPALEAGSHELVVSAGAREAHLWFAVDAAGVVTAVSTTGPVAPAATEDPAVTPTPTASEVPVATTSPRETGALAWTGVELTTPLVVGGLLLLAGFATVLLARRRRATS